MRAAATDAQNWLRSGWLPRSWLVVILVLATGTAGLAKAVDAPLREDRIRFVVHDLVAGQVTSADLQGYLDTVHELLHGSQGSFDVPTCTDFGTVTDGASPPVLFTSDGGLADSLAVIDSEQEMLDVIAWGETQGDRVGIFVQDIQWCGALLPNLRECSPTPGSVFVISLATPSELRAVAIAHARGHNAGLDHRVNDTCALMNPDIQTTHGCLDQHEAKTFYNQADIDTGGTCDCIDLVVNGPTQTWSLNPQGTSCDEIGTCFVSGSCNAGLCEGVTPLDCSDGDACTADGCNEVTGCTNDPIPLCIAVPATNSVGVLLISLTVLGLGVGAITHRARHKS